MVLVSAEDIFNIKDRSEPIVFHVESWGKDVYLRDPSLADRDEWVRYERSKKDSGGITDAACAKMAVIFVCNEKGERLFTDADIPRLLSMGGDGLTEITKRCVDLLVVSDESVEDRVKN